MPYRLPHLCRALRLDENGCLPSVAEVEWPRAKLVAVTRVAKERGRVLIAHFYDPRWIKGVGAGIISSSDDYILVEHVEGTKYVIASSFTDCFEFCRKAPDSQGT